MMASRELVTAENALAAQRERCRTLEGTIPKKRVQLEQARRDAIRLEAELRADESNLRVGCQEQSRLHALVTRLRSAAASPKLGYAADLLMAVPGSGSGGAANERLYDRFRGTYYSKIQTGAVDPRRLSQRNY